MKRSPRGPFDAVQWFCRDGTVLPPRPGACAPYGGGVQHGRLGPAARALRAGGFEVGQVLASLDPVALASSVADPTTLRQLVLERFLIQWDDGWIFRGARSYRGALQVEDEEAAAERILAALLEEPAWLSPARYLLLREVARALPLPGRTDLAAEVRSLAAELGEADPSFQPLRARIHSLPSATDAQRVRQHARSAEAPERYLALADAIDALFAPSATRDELEPLARRIGGALGNELTVVARTLASPNARDRLRAASRGLVAIRDGLGSLSGPPRRSHAMRASLLLEREAFTAGQGLIAGSTTPATRRERVALLETLAEALYGIGLVGERQLGALREVVGRLDAQDAPPLGLWQRELHYLARATEWSRRTIVFQLGPTMTAWSRIEPLALLYEADRLRGSPVLAYGALIDGLIRDAQILAGVENRLFGEPVGIGLRSLNPGLGRGRLVVATSEEEIAALPRDAVALLPETTAHLPPVAAILTRGEGSSVSHVQLLARNLGIPNAVVDETISGRIAQAAGHRVEMAVSPGGVVHVERLDEAALERSGTPPAHDEPLIRVDAERLRLDRMAPIGLDTLRAKDSGRVCGPKAANLGDLRRRYPDLVPDGFVIPFGAFRAVLERPIEPGGPSAFEFLRSGYARIGELAEAERADATAALLARFRSWITEQALDPGLRREIDLRLAAMSGGVFVRSDTNVEDLPGFTGAGLNLTVPNVVGAEAVAQAITRVWASPFTERAHAWRQALMDRPELVFPSVLVQSAFPAAKSGVMITLDLETGDAGKLSISVSEGVGGAVDGQATESILVDRATGEVRLLAQATAPTAASLDPAGGITRQPASGAERLLDTGEIDALRALADRIATHPALRSSDGSPLPADVEFAFRDGRLALLQLRPFVESSAARANERLRALDAPLQASADLPVPLDVAPGSGDQP